MGCERFVLPEGGVMYLCSRGRTRRRACKAGACGREASYECDHTDGGRRCDRPLCPQHAAELETDVHVCPDHLREREERAALAQLQGGARLISARSPRWPAVAAMAREGLVRCEPWGERRSQAYLVELTPAGQLRALSG